MTHSNLVNLNKAAICTDGEPLSLSDFTNEGTTASVYFKDLEAHLIKHIEEADYVFGCVAWLTSFPILAALRRKLGVCLVVQKEDFLRPDTDVTYDNAWKTSLQHAYTSLPAMSRSGFGGLLSEMSVCGDNTLPAVRCVGLRADPAHRVAPRSHHKFVLFAKQHDPHIAWNLPMYFPYAVWTGSYNFTKNAGLSFENAVVLTHQHIVEAYMAEFEQIAALSESLDWSSEYVRPQWRVGT
jgi:hypothetical protein